MNYTITLRGEYSGRIIGFNNSSVELGQRSDLNLLLIMAYESERTDYLSMFINPPTLSQLQDETNTFTYNTTSPTAKYQQMTIEFKTIAGQTQYPYPGQQDEDVIKNSLKGVQLLSLTQEGAEMFTGTDEGDMTGLDTVNGIISWVSPAPAVALKMKAIIQKAI